MLDMSKLGVHEIWKDRECREERPRSDQKSMEGVSRAFYDHVGSFRGGCNEKSRVS